jgi:hypothetical protein
LAIIILACLGMFCSTNHGLELSIKYEYSLDVDGINELFDVRNFLNR